MRKLISEKKFLKYRWPPKMPSYQFKQLPKSRHLAVYERANNPGVLLEDDYTSEKKARAAVKALREATNILEAGYEKRELTPEDEGFHTAI